MFAKASDRFLHAREFGNFYRMHVLHFKNFKRLVHERSFHLVLKLSFDVNLTLIQWPLIKIRGFLDRACPNATIF